MEIEGFDIEKVESLDFDTLSNQLQYIFREEQDVINFITFLKNVKNFINLSEDKKHMLQIDLSYFRTQIQLYSKRIHGFIVKKKLEQTKAAMKKAKGIGEKITENVIQYYIEDNTALENLEELYILVEAWASYIQDLYYICGQNNKKFGGYN